MKPNMYTKMLEFPCVHICLLLEAASRQINRLVCESVFYSKSARIWSSAACAVCFCVCDWQNESIRVPPNCIHHYLTVLNHPQIWTSVVIRSSECRPVRYANTSGLIRFRYELCLDPTPTFNIADVSGIISNKTLWMLIACMFLSDSEESMKLIVRRLKI